ncbi:uncharacterized protein LOC131996887 [Stomoxys calcitrans]|uniref:uncharacterized protein LOC131996887 n=1 Tax=Stomoxys calcitrans TaxID=35570 RepID=UPI0027E28970|nr:uncharacterized protein LOC131996887 [Stomoxys calcitrans]
MFFNGFHLIFIPATRNHRHGRAIGGKIYGISKKLEDFGITYEVNESSDAQLLIIRTTTYVFTLIPTYIRPDSWSEEFNSLKDVYNNLEITNGIIMGDLNVRIGELKQYLNEIGTEMFVAGYDVRKSKDKVINKKGKQFVEFCNDSNLFILNGITLGDGEGNVTYANTLGQSVNDICSASLELLGFVNNFSVDDKIWSDHFPIVLKLNYNISAESGQKMNLLPKLIWKDKMKYKYQRRLNEIMDNYEVATSNRKLSNLCEMITKSWPQKPNEMQSFQPKHKWYNFSCNEARLKSFKLLAKYRKSNNLEDKILYLKAQNSYKSICTNSKNMYYQNISAKINIINNAKEWWKMAREMRNHQNKISSHISPLLFKQHFENLLNTSQIMSQIHYAPPLNHDPILDGPITMGELENMLHKVKLNKAPGEDRIPYEFFVYATEQFHLQLLSTYNNIFNESTMDKIFTKSIIYPIHKKGDYDNPSNYRGISFMNCAAKIFMGILNDRIYTWAEENHILVEYQAGFRSYRLPNQLTAIVMRKNIFWVKELRAVTQSLNVQWPETINSIESWNTFSTELLCSLKLDLKHKRIQRKLQSDSRDYKFLNPSRAQLYLNDKYTQEKIAWIFKARSGMLYLGYNRFTTSEEERLCKLCNMRAEETFQHFLGICPILSEFRMMAFGKTILNQEEILEKLDGKNGADWDNIVTYLKSAYTYRHYLLSEFQ